MKLFTKAEQRYEINAYFFTMLRESLHLSVKQFATAIGWSVRYQYQLEEGKYKTVSEKTMKEICDTFFRYNGDINSLI